MPDYKGIRWCTIIFNLPLICCLEFQAKQTRKQKCLTLKTPSFQRCHITQKERSLILVAKGLQESILYLAKVGSTLTNQDQEDIFFNRKLPTDTFLRKFFIPVLCMHLKKRGTHGCLLVITLFIFKSKLCLTIEQAAPPLVWESYEKRLSLCRN